MFPDFNVHSSPLLFLVLQGLVFCVLLILRYFRKKQTTDLLLVLILLITCYHQVCYTIGFMGWYDTFRNTKVNYALFSLSLALAPLILLYVRSLTVAGFRLRRKHWWHFVPVFLVIALKLFVFIYDSQQEGFDDAQNGYMVMHLELPLTDPLIQLLETIQMIIYLSVAIGSYVSYRKRILQLYSNTYRMELNWLGAFLLIFSGLFLYSIVETFIQLVVVDLGWTQEWWYYLFSSLAILLVSIKGYFAGPNGLLVIHAEPSGLQKAEEAAKPINTEHSPKPNHDRKAELAAYMSSEQPFLEPELNLNELANRLGWTRSQLSEVINEEFGCNFNDFINRQRVDAFVGALKAGKHQNLSLLGVALDCGFNSKATFNRAFKKFRDTSPSEFVKSL